VKAMETLKTWRRKIVEERKADKIWAWYTGQ
jgi:hypothetical protein